MQTVKEDPERRGLLFAGTELGVFVSFDDGDHWQSLQLNLPPVSMRDLVIHDDDLIVGTHGRGFWVLDDITPLRQLSDEVIRARAYLFRPADAYNIPQSSENGTPQPRDEPLADNPPYGAMIDYYLKSASSGPVVLEILDPSGASIRKYSSEDKQPPVNPDAIDIPASWVRPPQSVPTTAGMHRWIWDLRPTPPPDRTARPGGGGNIFGPRVPTVLPGIYTVKLTVDGKSYTQPLSVKSDPRAK